LPRACHLDIYYILKVFAWKLKNESILVVEKAKEKSKSKYP
jgi:hypothetical protein